jgi:hypothetical protein
MDLPRLAELLPLNKIPIPGNPNPSSRWRWITAGVSGLDGSRIKLKCWYVANRPFTTVSAVSVFLEACTAAQEEKTARRSQRSIDTSREELAEVGL